MAASLTIHDAATIQSRRPEVEIRTRESTTVGGIRGRARGLTDDLQLAPNTHDAAALVRARNRVSLSPRYQDYMTERNSLVALSLDRALTSGEKSRLDYLRWQIDQIEDAEEGDHLDYLEQLAHQQRSLAQRIAEFNERLETASSTVFVPRKKAR